MGWQEKSLAVRGRLASAPAAAFTTPPSRMSPFSTRLAMLLSDCFGLVRRQFTSRNPTNVALFRKIRRGTVSGHHFSRRQLGELGGNTGRSHIPWGTIG